MAIAIFSTSLLMEDCLWLGLEQLLVLLKCEESLNDIKKSAVREIFIVI